MTALYMAGMRRLAADRQRALRRETARDGEVARRPSPSFRRSIGRALIEWGVRLAPDARSLVREGVPQ